MKCAIERIFILRSRETIFVVTFVTSVTFSQLLDNQLFGKREKVTRCYKYPQKVTKSRDFSPKLG